eukprot:1547061-Rhodomonas_salina.3
MLPAASSSASASHRISEQSLILRRDRNSDVSPQWEGRAGDEEGIGGRKAGGVGEADPDCHHDAMRNYASHFAFRELSADGAESEVVGCYRAYRAIGM